MHSTHRVLLLRFSSLGDLVLLSGLLDALRARHDSLELTLVTKGAYAGLFREDPRVDRLLELSTERGAFSKLRSELEGLQFDEILDAHASLRSLLLCTLLPPAPIRRLRKDALARWAYVRFRLSSEATRTHRTRRYAELAGADELPPSKIFVGSDAERRAAGLLPETKYLAVAPGARHASKQWPTERYVELCTEFTRSNPGRVVVFGGPGEEALGRTLREALGDRCIDLTGTLSLQEVAACLSRCELLLCNDSGLLHLAEAVGTPVLALYGPTSRELGFFPRLPESRVIEHALRCRPCSRNGSRPCHMPENWCLTRSTPDLVRSQLELQWRSRDPGSEAISPRS
jgi:heptosyltransferase-2